MVSSIYGTVCVRLTITEIPLCDRGYDADGRFHGPANALGSKLFRVDVSAVHDGHALPDACAGFVGILMRSRRNMLRANSLTEAKGRVRKHMRSVGVRFAWSKE